MKELVDNLQQKNMSNVHLNAFKSLHQETKASNSPYATTVILRPPWRHQDGSIDRSQGGILEAPRLYFPGWCSALLRRLSFVFSIDIEHIHVI